MSTGLSVQEKKIKIDFKHGSHGSLLGVPFGTILAIFGVQVTLMFPTKFQVNLPFGSGEEMKNRFSRWPPWRPFWISDQNDFSYFWSTSHPNASYQVLSQLAFCSEEGKGRFSRWPPWRPSWISDQNDFIYFWSTSHHNASYQVSSNRPRGVGVGFCSKQTTSIDQLQQFSLSTLCSRELKSRAKVGISIMKSRNSGILSDLEKDIKSK